MMGNQASVAIEKGRAAAEDAVGRAVGPITKCMSRDASQVPRANACHTVRIRARRVRTMSRRHVRAGAHDGAHTRAHAHV